jgi:polyisoprenoid-binding protein YceI
MASRRGPKDQGKDRGAIPVCSATAGTTLLRVQPFKEAYMSVLSANDTRLPVGVWGLDRVHSTVGFSVTFMTVSTFRSRFDDFDASLTVEEDGSALLVGTARSSSIAVSDPEFAAHLAAPGFFDGEQHPELRFESTQIRREGALVELDGLLTIKGRTLPVAVAGTVVDAHEDPFGSMRMCLELETRIDRRQFGLEWNKPLPKGGYALGDEVKLEAGLQFTRS